MVMFGFLGLGCYLLCVCDCGLNNSVATLCGFYMVCLLLVALWVVYFVIAWFVDC